MKVSWPTRGRPGCDSLVDVLTLVRHGRTSANATGRLQGCRTDPPLDEVGRAQADALLSAVHRIDRLIVSPALRARQTAEVFGVDPEVDVRWQEMDYGDYDGMVIDQIPADVWSGWTSNAEFAPHGGEALSVVEARVRAACEDLIDDARHGDVVVVTHATPIKLAMAWALGVEPGIVWRSFVDQASVTRVAIRDRGPTLSTFNLVP